MSNLNLNNWLKINQTCALCDLYPVEQQGVCQKCLSDLPFFHSGCPVCALPGSNGICNACQKHRMPFEWTSAGFTYRFPMPQLIHRIKSGKDPEPLFWLAHLLAQRTAKYLPRTAVLVPVPMHPFDQLMRGFNQSELLAIRLASFAELQLDTQLLRKFKRSSKQAKLNRKQRTENLSDCFEITASPPADVVLVDDVMTTSTTVRRLSELLLSAGCQRVGVCVLCRTPAD